MFYWDYVFGMVLMALIFAFTMGSRARADASFLADLKQADKRNLVSALLGGVVFNAANILLVAAIDIAGMSVAFPIGIGLALVVGVVVNYLAAPKGNPLQLFLGVALDRGRDRPLMRSPTARCPAKARRRAKGHRAVGRWPAC